MKRNNLIIFIILLFIIIFLVLSINYIIKSNQTTKISNFEECIAAGNPAMESYPRRCRDPITDMTFTEVIETTWENDGVLLMQNELDGFYGCFGCNQANENPALCIDPIKEMKIVEETEERHCNNNFEIVDNTDNIGEYCNTSSDCRTPMSFLIQSNCPFGSACIDSKCKVVCPLSFHDPSPEISKSYPFSCEINAECNCEERGEKTIKCLCVDGKCVSVEAE